MQHHRTATVAATHISDKLSWVQMVKDFAAIFTKFPTGTVGKN
jgi:hypothetical protein